MHPGYALSCYFDHEHVILFNVFKNADKILFEVFRPSVLTLIFSPIQKLYIVSDSIRGKVRGKPCVEVYFHTNLASVFTKRSTCNAQLLKFQDQKPSLTN